MLPVGVAKFYAVYLTLQALAGHATLSLTARSVGGALTLTAMLLLARVFDELKDSEADKALAAAGDPRYIGRPLVRGAVRLSDVILLKHLLTVFMWAIQVVFFDWTMVIGFGVAFFLLWCSSKWFFWPAISRSLLLALVTHNPLTLVALAYAASVFAADFGPQFDGSLIPLMLGLWMPLTAWETSRKLRIPEDETAYQTYTKVLGTRRAPWLPIVFVALATICVVLTARFAGVSWVFPLLLTGAAIVPIVGCVRFMISPTRQGARLQPQTEFFGLVVDLGLPLSVVVHLL